MLSSQRESNQLTRSTGNGRLGALGNANHNVPLKRRPILKPVETFASWTTTFASTRDLAGTGIFVFQDQVCASVVVWADASERFIDFDIVCDWELPSVRESVLLWVIPALALALAKKLNPALNVAVCESEEPLVWDLLISDVRPFEVLIPFVKVHEADDVVVFELLNCSDPCASVLFRYVEVAIIDGFIIGVST